LVTDKVCYTGIGLLVASRDDRMVRVNPELFFQGPAKKLVSTLQQEDRRQPNYMVSILLFLREHQFLVPDGRGLMNAVTAFQLHPPTSFLSFPYDVSAVLAHQGIHRISTFGGCIPSTLTKS